MNIDSLLSSPNLFEVKVLNENKELTLYVVAKNLKDAINTVEKNRDNESISMLSVKNLTEINNTSLDCSKEGYKLLPSQQWYFFDLRIENTLSEEFQITPERKIEEIKTRYKSLIQKNIQNMAGAIQSYIAHVLREPVIENDEIGQIYHIRAVDPENFNPLIMIGVLNRDKIRFYNIEDIDGFCNTTDMTYEDYKKWVLTLVREEIFDVEKIAILSKGFLAKDMMSGFSGWIPLAYSYIFNTIGNTTGV